MGIVLLSASISIVDLTSQIEMSIPTLPPGYIFVNEIPSGFLGRSMIVEETATHQNFLCKIANSSRIGKKTQVQEFMAYMEYIQKLKHPKILPYNRIIEQGETIFVFRPFLEKISLFAQISDCINTNAEVLFKIWKDITEVYKFLHQHNITSNFLKPSNIFISEDYSVTITDLYPPLHDMSVVFKQNNPISFAFLAPEYFNGSPAPNASSDSWSLGLLLYYMFKGQLPWNTKNLFTMMKQVNLGVDGLKKPIPQEVEFIVENTVQVDQNRRKDTNWLYEQEADIKGSADGGQSDGKKKLKSRNASHVSQSSQIYLRQTATNSTVTIDPFTIDDTP